MTSTPSSSTEGSALRTPAGASPAETLNGLLKTLVERRGSDLHIKVGNPPAFRIDGRLQRVGDTPLDDESATRLVYSALSAEDIDTFKSRRELDLAYALPGLARFRVNVFRQRGHVGAVFRLIPLTIPTVDDLFLPEVVKSVALLPAGLVLVTGPTGSGKSTTLAAMIQHINSMRRAHIITIEDPIEFVHNDGLSSITQREVGSDTVSFAEAVKHAVRQDPNVILVGELRDLETIALSLTAAETGHLVLGTLHTIDAAQTIDRVLDAFPPSQQPQIRLQMASTLRAVICQTLLARADGQGRVPALEILINTPAIASTVREGKTHQIPSLIQSGREHGMISLDQYLKDLYVQGLITFEEACTKCSNPRDFEELLQRNLTSDYVAANLTAGD